MNDNPNTKFLAEYIRGLFGDANDNINLLLKKYREIYSISHFKKAFDCRDFGDLPALRRRNFALVCAYNRDGKFLIINKSKESGLYLERDARLIGRTIDDFSSFCLELSANEIVKKYTGGQIVDLRPICTMENDLETNEGVITQHGIVFMALVDDIDANKVNQYKISFQEVAPLRMVFQNKEALELAINKRALIQFFPDKEEIDYAPSFWKRLFHNSLIKPIINPMSSNIIRKAIVKRISELNSVIDVSTGDDQMILSLSEIFDPDLSVANDINWKAMSSIMAKAKSKNYHILFTNHNLCELQFSKKFDLAICKNTLHHIGSPDELETVLNILRGIAKRVIILDVEYPSRSLLGKFFNQYYEMFLGDGADNHNFLTRNQFRNLILRAYPTSKVEFEEVRTVKGKYMLADVVHPTAK